MKKGLLTGMLWLAAGTLTAVEWSTNLPIFSGGSFDGWDRHAMSVAAGLGGAEISFYSASDQSLSWTQVSATLETVTIDIASQGNPIAVTNGGTLRISVPSAWGCRFDAGAALLFAGNAASKIDPGGVSYSADARTLRIPATANFLTGDTLTFSGLTLLDLALCRQGWRRLELDFDGDGIVDRSDAYVLTLSVLHPGGSFDGWDRSAMSAAAGLGGAEVTFSSGTDQVLSWTQPRADLEPLTLEIVSEGDPVVITGGGSLRISVPAAWACRFVADSMPVLGGSAAGKVNFGAMAYTANGRTLEIPVTGDFLTGDTLVISGLALLDLALCPAGSQRLELDFDGDGITDVSDACVLILSVLHPGGAHDGWDRCAAMEYQPIWRPAGTVFKIR